METYKLFVLFIVMALGCSGAKKFDLDECTDGNCPAEESSSQPSAGSGGSATNPPANDCGGLCSAGTSCVGGQCVANTGGTGGSTTNPPSGTSGTNNTAGTGGSSGSGGTAGSGGSSNTGGSAGTGGTAGSSGTAGTGGNTSLPCNGACATGTSCVNNQCVADQNTGGTGGSSGAGGSGGSAGCAGEAGSAGTGGNEADAGTDAEVDECGNYCGSGTHCESGECVLDEQDAGTDADTGTDADVADDCNGVCGIGTHCDNGVCVLDETNAGTGGTGGSSGAGGSGGTGGSDAGTDSGIQAQPVTVECEITHPDNQNADYYTYVSDEGIPDGYNGYYHLISDWEKWGEGGQPYTTKTTKTQIVTFASEWGSYIKINSAVNPEPGNFWAHAGCTSNPLAPALKYECFVTRNGEKKHVSWPEAKANSGGGCDLYFTAKWIEPTANDADGDGSLVGTDCNDADYLRRPGNVEVVEDGLDNDCYKGDLKKVRIIMDAPAGIGSDVHVTDWDKTIPMTYNASAGGWVTALLPPSQMSEKFLVEYSGSVGACYQGMCYDCRQVNGLCSPQYSVYGETSSGQSIAVTLPSSPYSEGCRRTWDPYNQ